MKTASLLCLLFSLSAAAQPRFPGPAPPPGWKGHVFQLSQDYPKRPPPPEDWPWLRIDFHTRGLDYLRAVLAYVYEGNVGPHIPESREWVQSKNKKRIWYNLPWMNREFIHGLTEERTAGCAQLAPTQSNQRAPSWGVGFYNPRGGYTLGQVWQAASQFNPSNAVFLEGTVAVKALFTEATETEVPYLAGSKVWQANLPVIPASALACGGSFTVTPQTQYSIQKVRLLQLDVAVKDSRAKQTGWVFGTFVYARSQSGTTPWNKMVPVGIAWGNDPEAAAGAPLKQAAFNPELPVPRPAGEGGRLNGMIDNPASACMLCHEGAEFPVGPEKKTNPYANLKSGRPYTAGSRSLDYSLSMVDAIANCQLTPACSVAPNPSNTPANSPRKQAYRITRGGKVKN